MEDKGIFINQEGYINNLLTKYNMQDCKIKSTPIDSGREFPETDKPDQNLPYRELIGAFLFLARISRPDISFAVNKLSQYCTSYTEDQWVMAKGILRYLKGTANFGIHYKKNADFKLSGYTDSDFAGDQGNRKSTSGTCFYLGNSLITWSSNKQNVVALSSTEAEYMAVMWRD